MFLHTEYVTHESADCSADSQTAAQTWSSKAAEWSLCVGDSPEEDRLSLPDGDIVHHCVVVLRIHLAADRQPYKHKEEHPEAEENCASPDKHRL